MQLYECGCYEIRKGAESYYQSDIDMMTMVEESLEHNDLWKKCFTEKIFKIKAIGKEEVPAIIIETNKLKEGNEIDEKNKDMNNSEEWKEWTTPV